MHIKEKYSWLKHLDFTVIDVFILVFSFSISYLWKFGIMDWWKHKEWSFFIIFICLIDILIIFLVNPYSGIFRRSTNEDIIKNFILTIYNIAVVCFILYLLKVGILYSRELLFEMYSVYFVLGLLAKSLWKKVVGTGNLQKKIALYIVCEKGKEEEVFRNSLADDIARYEIVGSSNKDGFFKSLIKVNAQEVLIEVEPGLISRETYRLLIANGIGIHMNIESMIGFQTENQFITKIGVYKTLSVGMYSFTPRQMLYKGIKRIFDIICGLIGLAILIPLSVVVKVANLCSGDNKKIFYTQKRIGQYGKEIRIYKFRSMVPNAEEVLKELLKDEKYRKEWEANQKFENDPRITKIGNFLRKTSLDEVPQLLNVLKGDSGIIGTTKKNLDFTGVSLA